MEKGLYAAPQGIDGLGEESGEDEHALEIEIEDPEAVHMSIDGHDILSIEKGEGDDVDIYNGRGYRVQIYSGNDRVKATETKVAFMRKFPNVKTYMSYVSPQFRVKVGDYRTRAEAQKMYNDAGSICNPCMIVPDNVSIVNIKKDD